MTTNAEIAVIDKPNRVSVMFIIMSNMDRAERLRGMVSGFWTSRVILTANNLRVFDHLETPLSARRVAKRLGLDLRGTELLLKALVSLKLLKKKDNKYINTDISSRYLVRGKPYYLGDIIRHNEILWRNWSRLDEAIKTGRPVKEAFEHESFIRGMHNLAILKKKEILKHIDLKGVRKILDLGGGPGTYSIAFARKGKDVTLFDRPETLDIAREMVEKEGLLQKISFRDGDFLKDSIGSGYDMVFMSQVLHAYGERENISLFRRLKKVLNPGGRIVIHEFYLDSSGTSPVGGALFSLNMLINTENGRTYSVQEIKRWLEKTGFKTFKVDRLDDTVLIQSMKKRRKQR